MWCSWGEVMVVVSVETHGTISNTFNSKQNIKEVA